MSVTKTADVTPTIDEANPLVFKWLSSETWIVHPVTKINTAN
jgi:hypothetical protein